MYPPGLFSVQLAEYVVFISYKHQDSKEFAKELEAFLDSKKKPTFRDESELVLGDDISEECKEAIRNSQVFLPILSMHYCEGAAGKEFCFNRDEARRPMIPVIMEGAIIPAEYAKEVWPLYVKIPADYQEKKDDVFDKILEGVDKIQRSGMIYLPCMQ